MPAFFKAVFPGYQIRATEGASAWRRLAGKRVGQLPLPQTFNVAARYKSLHLQHGAARIGNGRTRGIAHGVSEEAPCAP